MSTYSHNNATVEGFITHDATEKTTKTGKHLVMFSLAINHYMRPDEPPRVSFLEAEAWDLLNEEDQAKLVKGKRVVVSGVLRQDRWEDERGKVVSRLKIIANEIIFL
jgi:single-strand DNA-binding protein